jgi:proteic killer suppression protein
MTLAASQWVERLNVILTVLDAAHTPRDVDVAGFNLHPLKGDHKGQWAITVRANWRVTFRFDDDAVVDVDLQDYH